MDSLNLSICKWDPAPYLIFSDNIWGNFVYYSHLFPSLAILIISGFVFKQNPKGKVNQSLLFMAVVFTAWCLIDLVLWATARPELIMFFWSILIHFDLLIYVSSFYFVHTFITDKWPRWYFELFFSILFLPLILFAHTKLNLVAFDFTNCWREALEGPLWQTYVYYAELSIVLMIIAVGIYHYHKIKEAKKRNSIALMTIGVMAFLLSFSIGNIAGSLAIDWEIGQYGLFGMPILVVFLTYLIVRYQTFDIKIIATEAIITGLGLLILSLLFVQRLENVQVIASITFILVLCLGILLIRSVKKEVSQRLELEKLTDKLAAANQSLKILDQMKSEFVSIASHQLRSPLTSIRGYSSMLLEGSYGKLPPKATEAVERISDSSRFMALSVEDYLNVSRIQSGNMKYVAIDFNLLDVVNAIADELRGEAIKRGLVLTCRSDLNGRGIVSADIGKTRQIIQNLVDNALKYTKTGTITIFVHDQKKPKKIFVDVIDTGIGMKPETIEILFDKFERAQNANAVNVTGTGLGLYIARKMAQDMNGNVTAFSEGENKGSRFTFELPLQL